MRLDAIVIATLVVLSVVLTAPDTVNAANPGTLSIDSSFAALAIQPVDRTEPHQWSVDVRIDGLGGPFIVTLNQDTTSDSVQLAPGEYTPSIESSSFGGQAWVADVSPQPLDLGPGVNINIAVNISPSTQAAQFRIIKVFDPIDSAPAAPWEIDIEIRDAGAGFLVASTVVAGGSSFSDSIAAVVPSGTYAVVVTNESPNLSGMTATTDPDPVTVVAGANPDVTITNSPEPVPVPVPGATVWVLALMAAGFAAGVLRRTRKSVLPVGR